MRAWLSRSFRLRSRSRRVFSCWFSFSATFWASLLDGEHRLARVELDDRLAGLQLRTRALEDPEDAGVDRARQHLLDLRQHRARGGDHRLDRAGVHARRAHAGARDRRADPAGPPDEDHGEHRRARRRKSPARLIVRARRNSASSGRSTAASGGPGDAATAVPCPRPGKPSGAFEARGRVVQNRTTPVFKTGQTTGSSGPGGCTETGCRPARRLRARCAGTTSGHAQRSTTLTRRDFLRVFLVARCATAMPVPAWLDGREAPSPLRPGHRHPLRRHRPAGAEDSTASRRPSWPNASGS